MPNFEEIAKKEKVPNILGALGFLRMDDFGSRVLKERNYYKTKIKDKKELIEKICKKITGKENNLSGNEYQELIGLVEKELQSIERILKDAEKIENSLDVNKNKKVPNAWAGKVAKINEELLRSDHDLDSV